MKINAHSRGLATVAVIAGALLCDHAWSLFVAWTCVVALTAAAGVLRQHLRAAVLLIVTIGAPLYLLWAVYQQAPPGGARGSDPAQAQVFVVTLVLRLLIIGGVLQACLLPLETSDSLAATLRAWGLRDSALLIAIASVFLGPDLGRCAHQVLTARLARGFVARRTSLAVMRQLPFLLLPLLVRALRSAIQRAEMWEQRRLLERISNTPQAAVQWNVWDAAAGTAASAWLAVAFWERLT